MQGHYDVEIARLHVLAALGSFDNATWTWLGVSPAVHATIVESVVATECEFNSSLATWPWRAWNDTCYDAVPASPENHAVLHSTEVRSFVRSFVMAWRGGA